MTMIRLISWTVGVAIFSFLARPALGEAAPATRPSGDKPAAVDGDFAPLPIKYPRAGTICTPKNHRYGDADKISEKPLTYLAPKGCVNLARNRPVTSSDKEPLIGEIRQITDGDKEGTEGSWVELNPGLQWVQIDLGRTSTIHAIALWHRHHDPSVYHDVIVQVSDDEKFATNVKTIFNNDKDNSSGLGAGKDREYIEWNLGRVIVCDKPGVQGRYVRLYSNGNTNDDFNQYTEVEVYGIPAK